MIQFLKTRDFEVKSPLRKVGQDAGFDFYVPEFTKEFVEIFKKENEDLNNSKIVNLAYTDDNRETKDDHWVISIPAHESVLINAGIYSRFNSNIGLIANNKSGIATKRKLIVGAQVIDSSYEGLIHINLINTTNDIVDLDFGTKIVQFVPYIIDTSKFEVLDEKNISLKDFYKDHNSERGAGGFGSTGLN